MIEERGTVSLWLGKSTARANFEATLDVSFSDDGDFLGSEFSRAFEIGYYDEGLKESEYYEVPSDDLATLLAGSSYCDRTIERFSELGVAPLNANCVVLLFDYRHGGRTAWCGNGVELKYFGSVSYL